MLGESLWTLLGMLTAVAGILVLARYTTKLVAAKGIPGVSAPTGGGEFRVLRQMSLGRTGRLVLMRMGDKCLLLGVTEQQISLLREMPMAEAEEWLNTESGPAAGTPSFTDFIRKYRSGKK